MWTYIRTYTLIAVAVWLQTAPTTEFRLIRPDSTWDYKTPPCKIATADLDYTENGANVVIPPGLNITYTGKVFLGYTKTFEVFQYIGCIKKSGVSNSKPVYPDPGQCYSICNTTVFGIFKNECYCSNHEPDVNVDTQKYCNYKCSSPSNTACGGSKDSNNYISVYKHVYMSAKGPDDETYCRIYDTKSTVSFSWQTCNKKIMGLCQTAGATDRNFTTAMTRKNKTAYGVWYSYSRACFRVGMYPAAEDKGRIAIVDDSVNEIWIGRMKSWAIVAISNATSDDLNYGYYGYITRQDTRLQFTKNQSGSVLCIPDDDTTSTSTKSSTTASSTTTSTTTSTTSSPTTTTPTAAHSKPTTMSSPILPTTIISNTQSKSSTEKMSTKVEDDTSTTPSNQAIRGHESTEENGSSAIIAAYVVVPLVLVIAVVVVLLVVRWKRKQTSDKDSKEVLYANENSTKSPTVNGNAHTNATYVDDFAPNSNETQINDYFVLEPQYENSAVRGTQSKMTDDNAGEVHYSDANEVYDKAVEPVEHEPQANNYFVLEKTVESSSIQHNRDEENYAESGNLAYNYFVLEKPIERSVENETKYPRDSYDEHYDTTNAVKSVNATPNGNVYNTMSEFAEDPYNHTDDGNGNLHDLADSSIIGQATDNTYSHCTADDDTENMYNTVDGGSLSGDQQIDDTYNYIG